MRAHLSKKVKAGRAAIVQDMVQAIKLLGRRPLQLIVDKLRGPKACSVGAQNNTGLGSAPGSDRRGRRQVVEYFKSRQSLTSVV